MSWDRYDKFRPDCEGRWIATNWFNRKCTCIKWDTRFKILGYTHVPQVMNMELLNISNKRNAAFPVSLSLPSAFSDSLSPTLKKSSSTGLIINRFWVVPVHQPQASSIVHRTWTGNSFHTWYYTCFNAILPNHPTLSLSQSPKDCSIHQEGSGWGTRVYLWRIHVDTGQNQYNIVKLKNKIKFKK